MKKRCDMLNQYVCDMYGAFTQAQGFHWNVEGASFFHLHTFFGEIYSTLYEDIDALAERIRALGGYPPSTLKEIAQHMTLEEKGGPLASNAMVEVCIAHLSTLIECGQHIIRICEDEKDVVTADLLTSMLYKLDKYRWQATSYIKTN